MSAAFFSERGERDGVRDGSAGNSVPTSINIRFFRWSAEFGVTAPSGTDSKELDSNEDLDIEARLRGVIESGLPVCPFIRRKKSAYVILSRGHLHSITPALHI